jgi:hypothetical protein
MRYLAVLLLFFGAVASAQAPRQAVIQYTAVTTRTDGSSTTGAISYEVWQGIKGATKIRIGTITSLQTTIDTGLLGGTEYCWHIVVVEAGNAVKSAPSTEACKAFPQSGPNTVTITVI